METQHIDIKKLAPNTGQIEGLPANPREWTRDDVARIAASIDETPELFEMRPLLVYKVGEEFVVLGGNLRLEGAKRLRLKSCPAFIIPEDTSSEKLMEIVIKDNGSFGAWDLSLLSKEWGECPLSDWGVVANWDKDKKPAGEAPPDKDSAEYLEWLKKFENKKTTDDCFTPVEVYDALIGWLKKEGKIREGQKVVRPFYPGGDYTAEEYPAGCVVVDNPPFSIMKDIVAFYDKKRIPFFLFFDSRTLFGKAYVNNERICLLPICASVKYENGAVVNTSFMSSLFPGLRIYAPGELRKIIEDSQVKPDEKVQLDFDPHVRRFSSFGTAVRYGETIKIKNIRPFDNEHLYGGGILIGDDDVAKLDEVMERTREKIEEERERLAEERNGQKGTYPLSEKDRQKIAELNALAAKDTE